MKKILIVGLLILIVAMAAGYFMLNEKTELATSEKSVATTTANSILTEYRTNKEQADTKYLNKSISLEGKIVNITPIDDKVIVEIEGNDALESISCNFDKTSLDENKMPKIGDEIKLKGNCVGFSEDDIMGIKTVTLVQCLQL